MISNSKTIAILQPSYMPWIGYFDQISKSNHFIFYDDVQYDKNGWRNRNRIKSLSDNFHWLTVPVEVSDKPKINEVTISNHFDWRKKHLGCIRQFYFKAPYLKTYFDDISKLLNDDYVRLIDLNVAVIKWFCQKFEISDHFNYSSDLKIVGGQTERLVAICEQLGANRYLSGNSASDYLQVDLFARKNIEVIWHNYNHPKYEQTGNSFVPFLSAIDLLLNCGPKSRIYFEKN